MQVHHHEEVANRIGPESCAAVGVPADIAAAIRSHGAHHVTAHDVIVRAQVRETASYSALPAFGKLARPSDQYVGTDIRCLHRSGKRAHRDDPRSHARDIAE